MWDENRVEMSDLINRQDAIDILTSAVERCKGIYGDLGGAVSGAREFIKSLPSAAPERKKGYWVPVTNRRGGFECNQCHNYAPSYQNGNEYLSYFCPHCGAEMINEDIT